MARSPYWPNTTYLDIYIVFTFLITGCNASKNNEEMAGIIAGSILACVLFLAGIGGLVYCIVRSKKSKEAKKRKILTRNPNLDYRTVVVREMPGRAYPTIVGYSDLKLNYQPSMYGNVPPKMQMMSHIATFSHSQRPAQRPGLVSMVYSTSRPIKGSRMLRESYIDDQKSKRKSKSTGNGSIYSPFPQRDVANLEIEPAPESQFILRKKEDSSVKINPLNSSDLKRNEPYALTSLFSRDPEPSPGPGLELPHPRGDESPPILNADKDDPSRFPFTHSNPIVYPNREPDRKGFKSFSSPPIPPPRIDYTEPKRPVTPEYDAGSVQGDNTALREPPVSNRNRFSTAIAEELRQRIQSRAHSYGAEDSDPYRSSVRESQFNPMSSAAATSSIRTSRLIPGSYGGIPPAPPLPPT